MWDGRRFLVKGASYGTFVPAADGRQFPAISQIEKDFAQMAAAGVNTVRTYTPPTIALLDSAARHGLHVMAGLSWPQHVPFLDDARIARRIRWDASGEVRRLAAHPALLLFAVGNEIPGGIVRWHGQRRIERFLGELFRDVKAAAPASLFTYVNYPPTEFLDLDGFDLCAFNVYLHREAAVRAYLARLQHVAGDRPLLLAEAGSDSLREGLDAQARISAMNLRCAFEEGACGAVAYAWTDQWWRGGSPVHDWAFGLVDADRTPKPALAAATPGIQRSAVSHGGAGPLAQDLGGGLRLQRRRHARRMSRLAHRADLSGHGGHRRQRRITRRHGNDRPSGIRT